MKNGNIFKQMLNSLNEILNINKEHKEISYNHYKKSMPKWEQRLWYGGTIFVMILIGLIGIGLIHILFMKNPLEDILKIEITPPKIMLNEKGDINLEIKFTNIGETNISGFDLLKMNLYRIEDDKFIHKRQMIMPGTYKNDYYSMSCTKDSLDSQGNLPSGESCTIKTKIPSCPECFDDRKKEVQLYIYFDSVPPIKNQVVTIPIY